MRISKTLAVLLIPFGLGACAETEMLVHSAKEISGATDRSAPRSSGQYKVGNPYQIAGTWYYPAEDFGYVETGIASWYGPQFHGKKTANGEDFDMNTLTAAHRTLPLPSVVRVVNLQNGRSLLLRVNDRGPFARNRIIDVSRRAAQLLGFQRDGTARVRVEILPDESRRIKTLAQNGASLREQTISETAGLPRPVQSASLEAVAPAPAPARAPVERPTVVTAEPLAPLQAAAIPAKAAELVGSEPVKTTRLFVQAGAFVDRVNASRVRSVLAKHGAATVSETQVGSQKFFRVRVGPLNTVKRADTVLDRVISSGFPQAHIVVD